MAGDMSPRIALDRVLAKHTLGFELNQEQEEAIIKCVEGETVLVLLPTGYGKSVCYIMPPLVLSEMHASAKMALIISPLLGLMLNQVDKLNKMGIAAAYLRKDMPVDEIQGVKNGNYSIVFTSPEMICGKWRSVVLSQQWQERLVLVACDEAHCISQWGNDFRPEYVGIKCVRSLVPRGCRFMALTATATKKVVSDIVTTLNLSGRLHEVLRSPDRSNIHLSIIVQPSLKMEDLLRDTIHDLKTNGYNARKTVVYCRFISACSNVYVYIRQRLGDSCYPSGVHSAKDRIVDVYTAQAGSNAIERILEEFPKPSSRVRCVVATIAFGMGIDIPDIRQVLHWGCSKSVLSYWQEVGRAGRDGRPSSATMFATTKSISKQGNTDEDMLELCGNVKSNATSICIRGSILNLFYGNHTCENVNKVCCNMCDKAASEVVPDIDEDMEEAPSASIQI